jgi:hypothetical protein
VPSSCLIPGRPQTVEGPVATAGCDVGAGEDRPLFKATKLRSDPFIAAPDMRNSWAVANSPLWLNTTRPDGLCKPN